MTEFEENINVEYLKETARQLEEVKRRSYQRMKLERVRRILDVGCGPGIDTVAMAKLAPNAEVTGLDMDPEMLRSADGHAIQEGCNNRVRHISGSAEHLPFDNDSFDAVRAERLFQVISPGIATPEKIFGEMLRTLQPGGRLVLVDTDWATASVEFSDSEIERRIIRFFAEHCRPNGYAGRSFYRLMKEAGMTDVTIEVIPILTYSFDHKNPLADWLAEEAKKTGKIPTHEIDLWMEELAAKSARGEFLAVTNMNVVSGTKPQ